jgi:hypothetical protein
MFPDGLLANRCLQPLGHLSVAQLPTEPEFYGQIAAQNAANSRGS